MFPSDSTVSQSPTVFIPFVTVSIFRLVTTVYESQRFLFCLSLHLFPKCPQFASTSFFCLRLDVFSMLNLWVSLVFILFIAVSVFRVAHRATALHSDKAVESSLS